LCGADLCGADLSRAGLSNTNLIGAKLVGADLSRAELSETDLSRADLSEANLFLARIIRCQIAESRFENVDVTDCHVQETRGRPISPSILRTRGRGTLSGEEARNFFNPPATVEVYLSTILSDQEIG